jgi:hypothetical protein
MKNRNIRYTKTIPALVIAFLLGCFSLSPAAQANDRDDAQTIVGLWRVHYLAGGSEIFQSFDQWHSDGQEFEVANGVPGQMCQGTWQQKGGSRTVQLFHTGWNFDANGQLTGYFNETQINTVSRDGRTYQGTWDIKDYDTNGHQLDEVTGTLQATRLTVNTPL